MYNLTGVNIGDRIRFKYPDSKSGILKDREGVTENSDNGPNGIYVLIVEDDGTKKRYSQDKIKNLEII